MAGAGSGLDGNSPDTRSGTAWRSAAAPAGSDLYYGTLFSSPPSRQTIRSLHAFAQEIRRIPRSVSDPGVARIKLAWWREEVDRLRQRKPAHPLTIILDASALAARGDVDLAGHLSAIIDRREAELALPVHQDYPQLIDACGQSHGRLWQLCAAAGGGDTASLRAAGTLGCAFGIHEILHDLHDDLRTGVFRLPAAALKRHGIRREALPALSAEAVQAVATEAAGQIRQLVLEGIASLPLPQRQSQLALLTMTELMVKQLHEEQADGFRYRERRVMLTPLRKLWIAVRTRRRERRLARRHGTTGRA